MGNDEAASLRYSIDPDDRIGTVDRNWRRFAVANGAPQLTSALVLGTPVWDFIADDETARLWRLILSRVRLRQVTLAMPFRCDSPDTRRFMSMSVKPAPGNAVEIETKLVRTVQRAMCPPLNSGAARDGAVIKVCSWCNRVELPDAWVEVEDAVGRLALFERTRAPAVSHGVCPTCQNAIQSELGPAAGD